MHRFVMEVIGYRNDHHDLSVRTNPCELRRVWAIVSTSVMLVMRWPK